MSNLYPRTFDLFNFKFYLGPNPYLNTTALVFDFQLLSETPPLPIEDYIHELGRDLPQLRELKVKSYSELLLQTALEVSQLEMGLFFERSSLTQLVNGDRLALQSLHQKTTQGVVNLVQDWLEAITQNQPLDVRKEIAVLQEIFHDSAYGGPTLYSLLKTAYRKNIPFFDLPDERLIQYGYGKYQVRGISTTFEVDSQLDSDFTTLKDDCKAFLSNCGFPVPQGRIVYTLNEALAAVEDIGYPVAIKPVVGHKGIGVTANVQEKNGLKFAFEQAFEATSKDSPAIIIEQSITGFDFRLLCVGGKFVSAVERRPPYVTGDGQSTLGELIKAENATKARQDTPISPLGKIITDQVMENYLKEQRLQIDSVLPEGKVVFLRKVANLSSGGVSLDATRSIHPDNIELAQDVAQYFRLVCLGIDVIAKDMTVSWKEGNFGIIEINSAPGVYMHLNPAVGDSVDVPSAILNYLFPPENPTRIPIVSFNKLYRKEVSPLVDYILSQRPHWKIGTVCQDGIWVNYAEKVLNLDYNSNIQSLLRNPKLDLLIAEYSGDILERRGMSYEGSNLVILDNPSQAERCLERDLLPKGAVIIKQGDIISVRKAGQPEIEDLGASQSLSAVYFQEIDRLLAAIDN